MRGVVHMRVSEDIFLQRLVRAAESIADALKCEMKEQNRMSRESIRAAV